MTCTTQQMVNAMSYILIGAHSIREKVIKRGRVVDWIVTELEGETIIVADETTIFIFDLEQSCLHKLIGWTYSYSQIVNVFHEGDESRIRVLINVERDIRSVLQKVRPSTKTADRIKKITAFAVFLNPRICQLLDRKP